MPGGLRESDPCAAPGSGLAADVSEEMPGHVSQLDLLRSLCDAITPVMPVDMLERLRAGVSNPSVHLHGAIGGVAGEQIRPVVRHRDAVRDVKLVLVVELPGGLVDEIPHQLRLRM